MVHRGNSGEKLWNRDQYILGEGVIGKVVRDGNPILLDLTDSDPSELNASAKKLGIHQIAVVPLNGKTRRPRVMCVATRHPRPLDEQEVHFLQAIAPGRLPPLKMPA